MILRMFLHIIEEFHLALSIKIEGATISIGGEEKKQKIASNMTAATLPSGPASTICQGTEDATKWNECLAPSAFALMHLYLFDSKTRTRNALPQTNEMGKLFSVIAIAGNFLMAMKEIQLGKGVVVCNANEYSRLRWQKDDKHMMNNSTLAWFEKAEDKVTEDGEYLKASPGMLMGMLNAGSTTLGLMAPNHNMDRNNMKILTLRSSDDSMSLYMGNSAEDNKRCIEINRKNLGMWGINLSPCKTFFFREGLGEYTSWYMDKKFISQFGTETASLRPKGTNPQDDFNSMAKETSTALSTLTTNHLGASARLRIGIDGTRRIWRINRTPGKRPNISDTALALADGGRQPWDSTNCHLEEISLRSHLVSTDTDKEYLLRIRNPHNPFSQDPQEETVFSKEHGSLITEEIETREHNL
uniref:RNA-directed RNA polymerase catalytic subunit n=1 Tax=Coleopteran orthomyxo-related virus OKIAV185 TaxID=2746265 RepID=A0A7D7J3X5_9ORTO|nr:polymerase PB1 [Coleopteran orthomyxo-related virus OKIAV185]